MERYYRRDQGNKLIKIWYGVRSRTTNKENKDYVNYGGRGIVMESEWEEYDTFCDWALANGYEEGLHLDRIDNDGNYGPSNCQWLSASEHGKKGWAEGNVPMPPRYSPEQYREWNRKRFEDPAERAKCAVPRDNFGGTKITVAMLEDLTKWKMANPNWKKDWKLAHEKYGGGTKERYFRFWVLDKI